MNPVYLSLAGVVIGWVLNECSALLRTRSADKRAIGLALVRILRLESQMRNLTDTFEALKDLSEDWKEYETLRQHAVSRYIESAEVLAKQANEAVPIVAAISPISAMRLETLYQNRSFAKEVKFSASTSDRDTYIRNLSAMEAADEIAANELQGLALKIARKHGVLSWFRVRKFFQHRAKVRGANLAQLRSHLIEPFLAKAKASGCSDQQGVSLN